MNRRQKAILRNFIIVMLITAIASFAMINFKDWVNRSEAMRAMEHLGQIVLQYRKEHGQVPPQSYLDRQRSSLQGNIRLGKLNYRALWIDFESTPDEILCYTEKKYDSLFVSSGFIVLTLDGRVRWMGKQDFLTLLAKQQGPMEIEAGGEDSRRLRKQGRFRSEIEMLKK